MKTHKAAVVSVTTSAIIVSLMALLLPLPTRADWLKTNSPPDVDKVGHTFGTINSCWVATASNMLAGAGYGDGSTIQQRADDIYSELCVHLVDCNKCGWDDTALNKWLNSSFNTWKNINPYKIVTVHATDPNCKTNRNPDTNPNLPRFLGNELRNCNMARLSILKPNKTSGHSITAWGDEADAGQLTGNPAKVKVSDSDYWDASQDIQTYTYDDYNNPNPGGSNQGKGWYINYGVDHRYIDQIVTLSVTGYDLTKIVLGGVKKYIGSYRIHQNDPCRSALDLHYKVDSGAILSYRTSIDWDTNNVPSISENNNPPSTLTVNWNLADNPVPFCTWVTITTELVLPWTWGTEILNPITYSDVNFTYFQIVGPVKPSFGWRMWSEPLLGSYLPAEPNATGGYVIGAFDIYADAGGQNLLGQYRLISQYGFDQHPEHHEFFFEAPPQSYYVGNFRFGHSYAFLTDQALWQFDQWRTYEPTPRPMWQPIPPIPIDWTGQGLLPYPKGQDYPPPNQCGDPTTWYVPGDINRDCRVDFKDIAEVAAVWLQCTDPNSANCP